MTLAERIDKISNIGSDEMVVEYYLCDMPKRIDQSKAAARAMDWAWCEILDYAYPGTSDISKNASAAYDREVV